MVSFDRGVLMVFKGIVRNGVVELPAGSKIPDGMIVRIEINSQKNFKDLMELAGTWVGDDADHIVADIYGSRSIIN
ncbi:MAG: hypothetical protein ACYTF1_20005 [Planctomycetota bacterium]|jgi:hypothetical protein